MGNYLLLENFFALRGHSQYSSNTSNFSSQKIALSLNAAAKEKARKTTHCIVKHEFPNVREILGTTHGGQVVLNQFKAELSSSQNSIWKFSGAEQSVVLSWFCAASGTMGPDTQGEILGTVNNKPQTSSWTWTKNLSGYHCKYGLTHLSAWEATKRSRVII